MLTPIVRLAKLQVQYLFRYHDALKEEEYLLGVLDLFEILLGKAVLLLLLLLFVSMSKQYAAAASASGKRWVQNLYSNVPGT